MKIAVIGAAGVRTPLIVQSILRRQDRLGITELSLMDIDGDHLEIIGALTIPIEHSKSAKFHITRMIDPLEALSGADFVITTFRVGGSESRVIDEQVPLMHGVLGQETTGPGGFAMALRSIPVILNYVQLMQKLCPEAWLINFANPAGMLTEAVIRNSAWRRVVGICDAPSSMHKVICAVLDKSTDEIHLDYFGLNHLGWIKRILLHDKDILPDIIHKLITLTNIPGLPFESSLIASLGMIPNEYLYYYYYSTQAVHNILEAGESRGEQITRLNRKLFVELKQKFNRHDFEGMQKIYQNYLTERGGTYMVKETGIMHDLPLGIPDLFTSLVDEGYAGVALDLIETLSGDKPRVQILNIPNQEAINGLNEQDVVEVPTIVSHDKIEPLAIHDIPQHCMGLIMQIKHYERLTIEAAMEGSYHKARLALTTHPLVRDYLLAGIILDEYISKHQSYFPSLH